MDRLFSYWNLLSINPKPWFGRIINKDAPASQTRCRWPVFGYSLVILSGTFGRFFLSLSASKFKLICPCKIYTFNDPRNPLAA